jgi:small-conductance mechanosensitive channel
VPSIQDLLDTFQGAQITSWDILGAVVVVLLSLPIGRVAGRLARHATARVPDASTMIVADVGRLATFAVYFIGWAIALALVGFDVGWVVMIVIVFVVMGVLMLRPLIENSAAGLLLQARPSFGVGDYIKVSDYEGKVIEISARTTALKTSDGVRIHIPNTQVLSTVLIVNTAFEARRVTIDLGVDTAADLDAVSQILADAVSAVETVLADPAPAVIARSFGDGSINLSVRFWFGPDTHSDAVVTDQAIRALNSAISKAGIGLPAPQLMIQTQASHSDTEASQSGGKSDPSAS